MSDPRLARLAHLLTHHCIAIEAGDRVLVEAPFVAEPLVLALIAEILDAGANPHVLAYPDRYYDVYLMHGKEPQLTFTPTFEMLAYTTFEARVLVHAAVNTRSLSRRDPHSIGLVDKAWAPVLMAQFEREAKGEFKRVTTMHPTDAYAQDTGMGLEEFEELVYQACHVNNPGDDPVAYWTEMGYQNNERLRLLEGHRNARLRSADCDLQFSLEGRRFISASGKDNMPDGEIYTGPVEDTAAGWIRFTYPSLMLNAEVSGVELRFNQGEVVHSSARVGEGTLAARLRTDEGASRLGEFGIGTNYGLTDPTGMILLDEKLGGSIHLALGNGYPDTGSKNKSGIHWDLVTDFSKDAEISLDGDIVYKDGHFVT